MQRSIAVMLAFGLAFSAHSAAARDILQVTTTPASPASGNRAASGAAPAASPKTNAGPIRTSTVTGTNVIDAKNTVRTGGGGVLSNQVQAGARSGSTTDIQGRIAATQAVSRANQGTRTAVGSQAASSAVQQAVRNNNAAAGAAKGAGIAAVTTKGTGLTVNNNAVRASTASQTASANVQVGSPARPAALDASGARPGRAARRAPRLDG
ncbi:hypothetical protein MNEG_11367 [Monoraphidium neglectum]|uniref:Uncharacterized protein n=1 Tax=Monoraphidium neglectum TaxID=145388 RepID=A0A0D2LYY5_9CHLO|nr:hypothetical protein MNEG_11367 [Monoraphidium neglectum]KIY96594.1 hypothetical protein MNEG_11367 [Monoraphidium neglectum]|eukprot:XP_013895614.1 hypothetical protein MNEG_11367 [Monoraphidium neglectum]